MTVTITRLDGRVDKVRNGYTPKVQLQLGAGEYVASMELSEILRTAGERKTVDWRWTAYVVTP